MAAAYAAMTSLANTIHHIQHHPFPPISIDKEPLESLAENVAFFQEFLQRYKSPVAADCDEADPLEMRIADAAYAAEDFIECNIVDFIQCLSKICAADPLATIVNPLRPQLRRRPTEKNLLLFRSQLLQLTTTSPTDRKKSITSFLRSYTSPMKAINDAIKTRTPLSLGEVIKDMNSIKKDVMKMEKVKTWAVGGHVSAASGGSSSRSSIMVGLDDVVLEVLDKLTGGHCNRRVIPIVGMGGIGKTFLAMNVLENQLIKDHFDICAWATISQQYKTKEILCELLSQAIKKSKDELSYMGEDELELELHQYLSYRRFLIVLDDMWSVEAWEKIQRSFPDNNNSSRIVVTTRLSNLASQLDRSYCLKLKFLDEGSSWDLFFKSVFGEGSCPPELEEIGKQIVRNCRGLPLSIVVMGGLLKKLEHTQQCWESIRENSTSVVLNSENDFCLKILKTSYNHLPVHLKPCFLHMGVFEEDRAIRVSTLVKLWVSEGFLKPASDKSLEMMAKEYLNDLVDRNLVLVHELGSTGSIKYCRLHDLLRDLCLREAAKEGFYNVIGQHYEFKGLSRQRRVVIPRSTSMEELPYASRYRPLGCYFICDSKEVLPLPESRLLRTLKAYDRDTSGSHDYKLVDVLGFVNSRYLAVGVHLESKFRSSLGLVWNLHTLIVFHPGEFTAPDEIWEMPQLRHVEFHKGTLELPNPPGPSEKIVNMENLQTLKGVYDLNCEMASKIIPDIKKLGVLRGEIPFYLNGLSKLESFRCWNISYVIGYDFPDSLKHLSLGSDSSHWEVNERVLYKIGALPLLQKLKLERARFQLKQWQTSEDQFPCLKFLKLKWCLLESWMTESSHFPRLEKLHLCGSLEKIPLEIGEIPTLQSILLEHCSQPVVESAKNITAEQDELRVRVVLFNNKKNQALRKSLASPPNFLVEIVDF